MGTALMIAGYGFREGAGILTDSLTITECSSYAAEVIGCFAAQRKTGVRNKMAEWEVSAYDH